MYQILQCNPYVCCFFSILNLRLFLKLPPFIGRRSSECETKHDACQIIVGELCVPLKGCRPMKVPSPVSQLVINFCCKGVLVRVETPCGDCPVDNSAHTKAKMLPTLVVSELILRYNLPNFNDCVLRHDVHRCHY